MKFIELTVQNHIIVHGFDARNKEIIEEVTVDTPSKKMIAVNRVLSLSENYILISYAYDRIIYWEYAEDYEDVKQVLLMDS